MPHVTKTQRKLSAGSWQSRAALLMLPCVVSHWASCLLDLKTGIRAMSSWHAVCTSYWYQCSKCVEECLLSPVFSPLIAPNILCEMWVTDDWGDMNVWSVWLTIGHTVFQQTLSRVGILVLSKHLIALYFYYKWLLDEMTFLNDKNVNKIY